MNSTQAKAIIGLVVASIGSAITAAMVLYPDTRELAIVSAALTPIATYLGVYWTPNTPKG
jgi:hypothetical protein